MPRYISGYCDPQFPPPYSFKNVTIWSFPLVAHRNALTRIVDRYLNIDPSGEVRFRPIAGLVYMMVLHYGRMIPAAPPYNEWGYLTQNEFYFAIPIVRLEGGLPANAGLFTPYIFVDNPWSLVCGNTVIGFPKQMAWFLLPPDPASAYPIQIDAPVFVRRSPDTLLTWQRLVTIEPGGLRGLLEEAGEFVEEAGEFVKEAGEFLEEEESHWPFGNIEALFGARGRLPIESEIMDLLRNVRDNKLYSLVQLKQIRDAAVLDESCYTAIVNLSVGLDSVPLTLPLPPAAVDLKAYASAPYGQELGLRY
ncbi:MAG TPA: acetoacetate decarboxylase family protein, partial [Thermoanaerobaculia bacterium]